MKKRIFISAHYMEIGGAEISLIGLLNALDYSRVDVYLFLYQKKGELMSLIPNEVNILPEIPEYAFIESSILDSFRKGYIRQAFARLKAKFKYRKWAKKNKPTNSEPYFQFMDNEIMPTLPDLYGLGEFDLAINFIGLRNMIPSKIKYRKCVSWIHTDLKHSNLNIELELAAWDRFDHIISISPDVTDAFLYNFPSLKTKVIEIENILSPKFVIERSSKDNVKPELKNYGGEIHLLSIGRYCYQKNYDNVPDICRRLVERGIDLRWFIIGFGIDEEKIKNKIAEAGMERHVILLGKKTNPYPYIKACDVYVQPSRYEGKSVTVREAQMLGKPVVITDYNTAKSQVRNQLDGMIVPLDNEACANALEPILRDTSLQQKLSDYCLNHDFGNEAEIDKIYSLLS